MPITDEARRHHEELFPGRVSTLATNDVLTERGVQLPLPAPSTTTAETRELLTFALLVAHGSCNPQVKGHVSGNLKVGNDRARLIEVVTRLLPFIGYPRSLNALRATDEIAPPATTTDGEAF